MDEPQPIPTIASIRAEKDQRLDGFAAEVGIGSRSHASMIEQGHREPSPEVALAIERWSNGRIDAGSLNSDVALIDKARGRFHTGNDTVMQGGQSPGKSDALTGPIAA
jgi:transcriptional regulator with XRE-family HTH domain